MILTRSIRAVTDLFLQQQCPLCDRATSQMLCPSCWQQVQRCAEPQPAILAAAALPVLAWGSYQGYLKQAIAALKYNGNPQLAQPLGRALGQLWQRFPIIDRRSPLVVPIPMHADKRCERGFDQATLLSQAFCEQTGLKLVRQGLIRQRATVPQFGLGVLERQHNLASAFAIGPGLQPQTLNQPVLLLDDIYTTGITVQVAAAELRRQGISVCGVVAIARATLDKSVPTRI